MYFCSDYLSIDLSEEKQVHTDKGIFFSSSISKMKLLAIFVLQKEEDKKVKILQDEFNLESFGYFERRG